MNKKAMRTKKKFTILLLAGVLFSLQFTGTAQAGEWKSVNNHWYYCEEDGTCLTNCITPDGYYVNPDGTWYRRASVILNETFKASEKFPSAAAGWTGKEELVRLKQSISQLFEDRNIRITENSLEYLSGDTNETVLIGAYKNADTGTFRLMLGISLDKNCTDTSKAAAYDYQIFRAFLYQLTSTPELLEDAIYSSWEEKNRWQISRTEKRQVGDLLLKYTAGNGYGHYLIEAMTLNVTQE